MRGNKELKSGEESSTSTYSSKIQSCEPLEASNILVPIHPFIIMTTKVSHAVVQKKRRSDVVNDKFSTYRMGLYHITTNIFIEWKLMLCS